MSVQAQHPSSIPLKDIRKRACVEACINGIDDFVMQENLLQLYNAGANFLQEPTLNAGMNMAGNASKKKIRSEDDTGVAKQQQMCVPLLTTNQDRSGLLIPLRTERSNLAAPNVNSQLPLWLCPNDPPSVFEHPYTPAPFISNSGLIMSGNSLNFTLDNVDLQRQHEAEICQIIKLHGERLRRALEERRQQHTRVLIEHLDQRLLSCVREKMIEIEKLRHRNMDLEECVKRLMLESQVWQNVAQSQEALVTSLRSNLEQVVAQKKEQSKGTFGESDAEDAESCTHGASGVVAEDIHAETVKEIQDLRRQRSCKSCGTNGKCVLLLPCRHLCLCEECSVGLSNCPICGALKSGSLLVCMD